MIKQDSDGNVSYWQSSDHQANTRKAVSQVCGHDSYPDRSRTKLGTTTPPVQLRKGLMP